MTPVSQYRSWTKTYSTYLEIVANEIKRNEHVVGVPYAGHRVVVVDDAFDGLILWLRQGMWRVEHW